MLNTFNKNRAIKTSNECLIWCARTVLCLRQWSNGKRNIISYKIQMIWRHDDCYLCIVNTNGINFGNRNQWLYPNLSAAQRPLLYAGDLQATPTSSKCTEELDLMEIENETYSDLVCSQSSEPQPLNQEELNDLLKHGKTYKNQAEEIKRFNIFKDTLLAIEKHNALYEQGIFSYKEGINQFADMTQEEFQAMLTLSASRKPHFNTTEHVITGLKVPTSVDWRTKGQVTGVKDQGSCGSCWAFSITGSTEAAYYRKAGKLVSLSEQQLVDCSTSINEGCNGGYLEQTFPYVEQYGLVSEANYPYTGRDGTCKYKASEVVTKVSSYKTLKVADENALLDAVANVGPVSVAMDANLLSYYSSGIFSPLLCSHTNLNHGVLVVGYGAENNKNYWIVKNSWGTSWGEDGFFRIARGSNKCGIAEDTVYPTV